MINTIKIKCPLCGEESELFLSMNPSVIVLNCPECWTPLMYNNNRVNILSEYELNNLSVPSQELELDNLCNIYPHRENQINRQPSFRPSPSIFRQQNQPELVLKTSQKLRKSSITTDDILDLRIELAQCKDVMQFIEKL